MCIRYVNWTNFSFNLRLIACFNCFNRKTKTSFILCKISLFHPFFFQKVVNEKGNVIFIKEKNPLLKMYLVEKKLHV